MWHLNNLFFLILAMVISGCFSKNRVSVESDALLGRRVRILSSDIKKEIDQENFSKSLEMADSYLLQYPIGPHTPIVQFYKARSLEGLGHVAEAITTYRQVIRMPAISGEIAAAALYRLSFCYEELGEDDKLVAALLEALARKGDLDKEVATAEIPARMAAAYSRLGNKKLAEKYYSLAEKGIRNLKAQNSKTQLGSWLPKTLYFMGVLGKGVFRVENFESSLAPLERAQNFLLEAALAGDPKWSPKSVQEIKSIYTGLLEMIHTMKSQETEDPEIAQRNLQEKKWKMAALTLEVLTKLKMQSTALGASDGAELSEINSFISAKETELNKVISERPAGEGLTLEAEKRRKNLRKLRVVNPDPALEQGQLRTR